MPPSKPFSGRRRSSTAPSRAGEPERDAIARRPLRLLGPRRDCVGQARCGGGAAGTPRAEHATRPPRRADRGAEIHQGLGEIAGPLLRNQRRGERSEARFCRGKGFGHGVKPGEDTLDIAVDRRGPPIEGDRGDRRRGVVADPGQCAQRRRVARETLPPCRSTTARAQACRLRARA